MGKFKDLTGKTFGRLHVMERDIEYEKEYLKTHKYKCTFWKCKCECGNIKTIYANSLINNKTTSCGCYRKEQRLISNIKHGLSHSRIKRIYYNMYERCYNKKNPRYNDYGGRGIKICDEWIDKENGLINFYEWAINNGYKDDLTIDRIDVNGNYEPNNCRWLTNLEQQYNKRCNVMFTIDNETKTAKEWCDLYDININTFWERNFNGYFGEDLIYKGNLKKKYNLY